MSPNLSRSLLLLCFALIICCGIYPLALWAIGQVFFPFQANGSLLTGPDDKPVGSFLIAQSFTGDEYFHPRPSAASYNAAASASSSLAASNYLLRDRVARTLGPMVKYRRGPRAGQVVGPDIDAWFRRDEFQGRPGIVPQWAHLHMALARAWVKADPAHAAYVKDWMENHPALRGRWARNHPGVPLPAAEDFALEFFDDFSRKNPGRFPAAVMDAGGSGSTVKRIEPVGEGMEIQSIFFDMWRQDHPHADLVDVPGDLVTTSASGLDPHISLENAELQLDRVAAEWSSVPGRDFEHVRQEVHKLIRQKAAAPLAGLAGEKFVNVLEVNLELRKRYGGL